MSTEFEWPRRRARYRLVLLAAVCAAIIAALGAAVYHGIAKWSIPPIVRHYFLGFPIDNIQLSQLAKHRGEQVMVIWGDPRIFTLAVIALAIIAWLGRDRWLSLIAIAGPVSAEILTELICKPFFHRVSVSVSGISYTYPSGHVTATASIMAVLAVIIRRAFGARAALLAAPLIAILIAAAMLGVILLHMHDLIDAIGGLCMGTGVIALWTASIPQPRGQQNGLSTTGES